MFSCPLGVLKKEQVTFEPPLPEWKKESISKLGFGAMNKVAILFPNLFWNETADMFGYVPDSNQNRGQFFLFLNF